MDLTSYHAKEFLWHCQTFFDFRKHLDDVELAYLSYCFTQNKDIVETTDISSKSYNHRITKDGVNSSRLGYGFRQLTPEHIQQLSLLLQHKLPTEEHLVSLLSSADGAGVAFDILSQHFKVYYYFAVYDPTSALIPEMTEKSMKELCGADRIVAYTYHNCKLIETKYYYYPRQTHWAQLVHHHSPLHKMDHTLGQLAKRLAFVLSDNKPPRFQWDIDEDVQDIVLKRLGNKRANELALKCKQFGQVLDTVVINPEELTLYFN